MRSSLSQGPQTGPAKFVLDDPVRVKHILDHGQDLYRQHRRPQRRHISTVTEQGDILRNIRKELNDAKIFYPFGNYKKFIEIDNFEKVFSPERVLQIISTLGYFRDLDKQQKQDKAQDICFGRGSQPPSLRVIGALIGSKQHEFIRQHLEEDLNDSCLPLEAADGDKSVTLKCRNQRHRHSTLDSYEDADDRENFLKWTRLLTAPFIGRYKNLHSHYVLDSGNCLPITHLKDNHGRMLNTPSMQSAANGVSESDESGGFSHVYKVKISNSHCNFAHREVCLRIPISILLTDTVLTCRRCSCEIRTATTRQRC
jgi:hypothetical protein